MPPAVVLVPGLACVGSIIFAPLVKALHSTGFDSVHALDLPSVDPSSKLTPNPLEADIAALRALLSDLIEKHGMEVLLVGHSYGGTPALAAAEGFWTGQRSAAGKHGGITRAALIASSLTLPGMSVAGARVSYQQTVGGVDDPLSTVKETE